MRYEETKSLTAEQFRRLTGVKRPVFEKMLSILHTAHVLKKAREGLPDKPNSSKRIEEIVAKYGFSTQFIPQGRVGK